MKLVYPHDLPRLGVEQIYRHSRLIPIVVFSATSAFAVGWAGYIWLQGDSIFLYWPSVAAGLVALFTLSGARAALRSTNWLVKTASDGVYIKFRSYLNHRFPDDGPTILHLAPNDIASVGGATERVTLPNRDGGDLTATLKYLDIRCAHSVPGQIAHAIQYERRRRPPNKRISTKYHDYPVSIVFPDTVRIHWAVRPDVNKALDDLGERYGRSDGEAIERTPWNEMSPEEQESLIIELCERGEAVTAIRLARMRYDMNLTEAKRFVDEIMYEESKA